VGNSSNAGFVGLMTPTGIAFLILFFFLLIAVIAFGAAWVKAGEARAREERRQLKEMMATRDKNQT
jgi:Na+-transporting methylmalonyl-CoA/oxaloacetate decarboxylase gamma subunit